MEQQYFQEGEEVILVSKTMPELNGEYVIEYCLPKRDSIKTSCGSKSVCFTELTYTLVGVHDSRTTIQGDTTYRVHFSQKSLRKKYKPSDDSFEEMIKSLKLKDKMTNDN